MSLDEVLSLFGVVIVVALLISVPIIAIRRLLPSTRKSMRAAQEAEARETERLAEYERAGMKVRDPIVGNKVVSSQHAGVRFEHYVISPGKNSPARVAVSIATTAPGEFHVSPETAATKMVKQAGMVDEFQTGDGSFDRKYYFSGSTDEYVKAVFGVRENLEQLRALFAAGPDELEKSETHLIASRPGAELLGTAELKTVVEQLARFRLPTSVPGVEGKRFLGKRALYVLRATMVVLGLFGFTGFFVTNQLLDGWVAFAVGVLPVLAVLCVAMLAAAYLGLKGRSMAARGMVELLLFLPPLAMALVGVLALANQQFDGSEAAEHEVRLTKRFVTHGGKNNQTINHHVQFESWRARDHEAVKVPVEIYDLAREGDVWRVRTRRGWLGHLWVESVRPRA